MTKLSESNKAYFAGYFDAEGNVSVELVNGRTWRVSVTFGQTQPDVIVKMHKLYPARVYAEYPKNPNKRPKLYYRIRSWPMVKRLLSDLCPYLHEKREQVELVLTSFHSKMTTAEGEHLQAQLLVHRKTSFDVDAVPTTNRKARPPCVVSGCKRRSQSRSLCTRHYQQQRLAGVFRTVPLGARLFTYKRAPTDNEIAYFAGYFDGDGSIEFQPLGTGWTLAVVFSQTQPEAVIKMWEIYDGSLRISKARTSNRRKQLRYVLRKQKAVRRFLTDVQRFCIEKRKQVAAVLTHFAPSMSKSHGLRLSRLLRNERHAVADVRRIVKQLRE